MSDNRAFLTLVYVMNCALEPLKTKQINVIWDPNMLEGITGCAPVFDMETNFTPNRLKSLAAKIVITIFPCIPHLRFE